MISFSKRIAAFIELGNILSYAHPSKTIPLLDHAIEEANKHNTWFTYENIAYALHSISLLLKKDTLQQWTSAYNFQETLNTRAKKILVIMAGNIPLVGFHDFLCVLISGHKFLGKLSSEDNVLLPALAEVLLKIEPGYSESIEFTHEKAKAFDAVIATGSDNSSRYFEYYFGKVPHIIRKHRNSIAVLSGDENESELNGLAEDICMYFGMGCRSVSELFIPSGFDVRTLFPVLEKYREHLTKHNKYMNNYEYNKALFLMNQVNHLDNGFMLFTENAALSSPVSVLNFEYYQDIEAAKKYILSLKDKIQCIVGKPSWIDDVISFGKSQQPGLFDYADGIDTIHWLNNLS